MGFVSEDRRDRYRSKLGIVKDNKDLVLGWIRDLDEEMFLESDKDRYDVYKAYQEVAEASMDILGMWIKDSERQVEDDYTNIEKCEDLDLISKDTAKVLKNLNGLRNRLIHEYNQLSNKKAYNGIKETLDEISRFEKEVEQWIKKS